MVFIDSVSELVRDSSFENNLNFNESSLVSSKNQYNLYNVPNFPQKESLEETTQNPNKIIDSVNILKSIIDQISKVSDKNHKKNEGMSAYSNIYDLAKNSVKISYKDYLLHKSDIDYNFPPTQEDPIFQSYEVKNYIRDFHTTTRSLIKYSSPILDMINSTLSYNLKPIIDSKFNEDKYIVHQMDTFTTIKSSYVDENLLELDFFNNLNNLMTTGIAEEIKETSNYDHLSTSNMNNSPYMLAITILYSILIITSLTSNPLLIYVLLWCRKTQIKLIDIFVVNLSLSDLFLTIFNIPLSLIIYFSEEWPFGSVMCQLGTYSTSCSIYVNIFTMAYISIDRYFAVTRPLISNQSYQLKKNTILIDDRTKRKIYIVITLIWIIALILSVPQFLFTKVSKQNYKFNLKTILDFNDTLETGKISDSDVDLAILNAPGSDEEMSQDPFKKCLLDYDAKNYLIIINFLLQYLIPSIIILYFYGKIIYHLYLNLNIEEFMESPVQKRHIVSSKGKFCGFIKRSRSKCAANNNNNKDINSSVETFNIVTSSTKSSTSQIKQKNSKMRIEGLNRTQNLKKSIKTMVIIIALFLLSWLPIHLYRLITTLTPFIKNFLEQLSTYFPDDSLSSMTKNNTELLQLITDCSKNNSNEKDCISKTVNKALKDLRTPDVPYIKIPTLHNRYVFFICYFMSMSSVCYNPVVYFWMHKKFRTEVKNLFKCIFRSQYVNSKSDSKNKAAASSMKFNSRRTDLKFGNLQKKLNDAKSEHVIINEKKYENEDHIDLLNNKRGKIKRFCSFSSESSSRKSEKV